MFVCEGIGLRVYLGQAATTTRAPATSTFSLPSKHRQPSQETRFTNTNTPNYKHQPPAMHLDSTQQTASTTNPAATSVVFQTNTEHRAAASTTNKCSTAIDTSSPTPKLADILRFTPEQLDTWLLTAPHPDTPAEEIMTWNHEQLNLWLIPRLFSNSGHMWDERDCIPDLIGLHLDGRRFIMDCKWDWFRDFFPTPPISLAVWLSQEREDCGGVFCAFYGALAEWEVGFACC